MKTIYELIQFRGKTHPDRLSLFFEGQSYTYSQFAANINRCANFLKEMRIRKKSYIGILDFNTPLVQDLLFASSALGIIPVILNWRLTFTEIQSILDDANVEYIFSEMILKK